MTRLWTVVPIILIAAVPIWTAASAPVFALAALACLLCAAGVLADASTPVAAGASVATIGYTVALWSGHSAGVDVVGAAVFGLSVLFLLDLSEFGRRFRGADIADDVLRAQAAHWLGRAAIIAGIVAALSLFGFVLSLLVPGAGRAVIAGFGAILSFAGALRAGIVRRPGDIS